MRIDRFQLEGFGHFSGRELSLRPGLNVVHGENEAGKSTLLAFIRAILYGFERSGARYEPAHGVHGGALLLTCASGPLGVRRVWRKSKTEGDLTLLGSDSVSLPAGRLAEALGGVGRDLFCQLFAFGLDELAVFSRLAKESSVAEALFAAGMRGAQRLPQVSTEWKKRSEAIFSPSASKKPLNEKLTALREVRRALEGLGDRPGTYFERCAQRDALADEEQRLSLELGRTRAELASLGALVQAAPALADVVALRAALGALPSSAAGFPEEGLARLEDALGRRRRAHSEKGEVQGRLESALREGAALREALLEEAVVTDLGAAQEAFAGWLAVARGVPARSAALDARTQTADAELAGLGLPLTAESVAAVDAGAAAQARLSALGAERARSQAADREAEAQLRVEARRLAELDEALERNQAAAQGLCQWTPAERDRRQAAVERCGRLEVEARGVRAQRAALADEQAAAQPGEGPGAAALLPVTVVWVAVAAALVGAVAAGLAAGPTAALGVAGVGAAAVAFVAWVRARVEASAAQARAERDARRARLAEAAARLAEQAQALEQAQAAALREAGVDTAAAVEALLAELPRHSREVDRREALWAERAELVRRREGQGAEAARATQAREAASRAAAQATEAVRAFVRARGLPQDVDPEAALGLLAAVAQVQARLRDLQGEARALGADQAQIAVAAERLRQAAARAGLTGQDDSLCAAARELLERQAGASSALRAALQRAEELRPKLASLHAEHAAAEEDVGALFAAAGAKDEESFRKGAADAARLGALGAELASAARTAEAAARRPVDVALAALAAEGGPEAAAQRLEALEAGAQALAQRQLDASAARGEVRKELEGLETDALATRLRADEERLLAEIRALATRYAQDRLGLHLLARARRKFEEEQQPRVVQLASGHFSELTGHRYVRVFVPAEESPHELCVVDGRGETRRADALSRGTREQLYLAFRLAVVEDFGETRAALPLVLDDILVNFDPRRAKHAAEVLARLSARHQVLAFTCHAWMRDLLREHGAHAVELDARALDGGAALPAAGPGTRSAG